MMSLISQHSCDRGDKKVFAMTENATLVIKESEIDGLPKDLLEKLKSQNYFPFEFFILLSRLQEMIDSYPADNPLRAMYVSSLRFGPDGRAGEIQLNLTRH